MNVYLPTVCKHMRVLYDSLSKKDRRRYAAIEAEKLGHGGVAYLAGVLGCHVLHCKVSDHSPSAIELFLPV